MMKWMRERLSRDEGFTLIELMVVVLIIAVLVAIAIPSFLGFRNRAQDRSAQSDVRNAILAEKGYWTDEAAYTDVAADLQDFMPTLTVNTTDAVTDGVYVDQFSNSVVCLQQASDSGKVWAAYLSSNAATEYGEFADAAAAAAFVCNGTAPGWPTDGW